MLSLLALLACTSDPDNVAPPAEPDGAVEGDLVVDPTTPQPAGVLLGAAPALDAAQNPIALESAVELRGYAVARVVLSTGDLVQIQSACNEWGTFTGSFMLSTRLGRGVRVIPFAGGPVGELGGRMVVVSHVQVGSDGSDEPLQVPEGAQAVVHGSNGALYVTRVIAVDLVHGVLNEASWDTLAPATAGPGRMLVLSKRDHAVGPGESRIADELVVWDPGSGAEVSLGKLVKPPLYGVLGDELVVKFTGDDGPRMVAVHGGTGQARDLAMDTGVELRPEPPGLVANAAKLLPAETQWLDTEGRTIRLRGGDALGEPVVGSCGVSGTTRWYDLLLDDRGAWWWPSTLQLEAGDGE